MKPKIALFCFLLLIETSFATKLQQDQILHGTVNVALGNGNGMVIAADGLLSGGAHPTFAQKLFQLDKYSVCTIAGFYSTDDSSGLQFFQLPESALHLEVRAIISYLRKQLEKPPALTIDEKAHILAFQISKAIEILNSVKAVQASGSRQLRQSSPSQLVIAGYNPDGSAEIAKISMTVDSSGSSTTIEEASEVSVTAELVWKTAGIEDEAVAILKGTARPDGPEMSDAALKTLYSAKAESRGITLSVAQMTEIAKAVIRYSASAHSRAIGGEAQFAVLQKGKVSEVSQHEFSPPPLPRYQNRLFSDVHFQTTPGGLENYRPFGWYGTGLYVRSSFNHVSVTLDSGFFGQNTFTDCDVFYDGAPFEFEPNNTVENCSLLLGPRVDPQSPKVLSLVQNFHWKFVGAAKIPANYPHW
jgi:hypothetical protein